MTRHLIIVSLSNTSQVVCSSNPIVVSNGDVIRWTTRDGDLSIRFPGSLIGTDTEGTRDAPSERFSAELVVNAAPGWYQYEISLSKGGVTVTALPHVIVT